MIYLLSTRVNHRMVEMMNYETPCHFKNLRRNSDAALPESKDSPVNMISDHEVL